MQPHEAQASAALLLLAAATVAYFLPSIVAVFGSNRHHGGCSHIEHSATISKRPGLEGG